MPLNTNFKVSDFLKNKAQRGFNSSGLSNKSTGLK
jgi:hypothetical protein